MHITLLEPWRNRGETSTYVLVSAEEWPAFAEAEAEGKGKSEPGNLPDTLVIPYPLSRIAALVSGQTAFISALGAQDKLLAVADRKFLYSPTLRQRIVEGKLAEVGDGPGLDLETLSLLHVQAVFHGGSADPGIDNSPRLRRAGLAAIESGDWMEAHPLGRAEWIKFYGALLGKAALADSLFAAVEANYLGLRDSLQALADTLKVISGAPWRGIWHVPGGRSYPARLAKDAGLRYLWAGDSSEGSLALTPEAVLARGSTADLWINPGNFETLEQARNEDSRYQNLPAFRRKRLYAPIARRQADGGNDYWETGVVRPDWLLRDLARMASDDSSGLYFFKRLPDR